ncbi:Putative aminoacrylate hydrolase RutD [bacterium YEK0313]|nr:Putative aminoacrylate hydrolase RutD [bacterium YEK0313]
MTTTFAASTGTRLSVPLADGTMSGLAWGESRMPPDLLFMHATGFNAQTYAPLLEPLAARHAIIALDQRGHGFSDLPTDPAGIVDWMPYARDLIAVLDRFVSAGARPLVLAGHSMGAVVSLLAAAARPKAVRGLVLLDPVMMSPMLRLAAYTPWGRAKFRSFHLAVSAAKRRAVFGSKQEAVDTYRTRKAFSTWQPGFLEAYVDGGFVADGEGVRLACAPIWESATFASHRHRSWAALKSLQMPVHVMAAERGSTVTGGIGKVLKVQPRAQAEVVAGTTHFFPMERPDHVRAQLAGMLAKT